MIGDCRRGLHAVVQRLVNALRSDRVIGAGRITNSQPVAAMNSVEQE